jgi:hypothetical protein
MTVETDVQAISGYTVGASGTITTAELAIFEGWAGAKIATDGVTSRTDEAMALLVCHFIACKGGESGKTSESIGKYSYTRSISTLTSWMDLYNDIAKGSRTYLVKVNR